MMQIAKKERKELDALSKDVFGSSSRWQKFIEKGYEQLLTEEVEETVPAEKEGEEPTKRKVQAPILKNGSRQLVTKYHTVESVREMMLKQKEQLDGIRAQIKKQQDEMRAKQVAEQKAKEADERAKQVHQQLSGSAK